MKAAFLRTVWWHLRYPGLPADAAPQAPERRVVTADEAAGLGLADTSTDLEEGAPEFKDAAPALKGLDPRQPTCDATDVFELLGRERIWGPCVLRAGHEGPGHKSADGSSWAKRADTVPVPRDALRRLVEVAMWVSRGRSMAFIPDDSEALGKAYPDAKARFALGALDDAGLLEQFREEDS